MRDIYLLFALLWGSVIWTEGALAAEGISVSGTSRVRYETLDGQFRAANGGSSDQAIFARTQVLFEGQATENLTIGVEVQDSRGYLDDDGTPLSAGFINPLDVLQAYARFKQKDLLWDGWQTEVTLGRQTVAIGSSRQIERPNFANVTRGYTGIKVSSVNGRKDELHFLAVVPVARRGGDRDELGRNKLVFDLEQFGRKYLAVHYRRADALPQLGADIWVDGYVYGLLEGDTQRFATPNRRIATPGFRVYRKPVAGQWDIDLEGALRYGSRLSGSGPNAEKLDVKASMLFAALGYTWDAPWQPRLALEFYWASGDEDPTDGEFNQYERLFNARRTDLNNTSLHGPLTPANLSAPGVRLEVKPSPRTDARLYYHAASLASGTDRFVVARLQDPTGASGRFIGHEIDGRLRYRLIPGALTWEIGGSALFFGGFTRNVPGGPSGNRTLFSYSSLTWSF